MVGSGRRRSFGITAALSGPITGAAQADPERSTGAFSIDRTRTCLVGLRQSLVRVQAQVPEGFHLGNGRPSRKPGRARALYAVLARIVLSDSRIVISSTLIG